jgi:hypothetical protein
MSVYVDDMYRHSIGRLGRMKMSHLIADTDEELHALAQHIGIARRNWQSPASTSGSHYDICMSKRQLAVAAGAIEITLRQCAAMNKRRRVTGQLGDPQSAEAWLVDRLVERGARFNRVNGEGK